MEVVVCQILSKVILGSFCPGAVRIYICPFTLINDLLWMISSWLHYYNAFRTTKKQTN